MDSSICLIRSQRQQQVFWLSYFLINRLQTTIVPLPYSLQHLWSWPFPWLHYCTWYQLQVLYRQYRLSSLYYLIDQLISSSVTFLCPLPLYKTVVYIKSLSPPRLCFIPYNQVFDSLASIIHSYSLPSWMQRVFLRTLFFLVPLNVVAASLLSAIMMVVLFFKYAIGFLLLIHCSRCHEEITNAFIQDTSASRSSSSSMNSIDSMKW